MALWSIANILLLIFSIIKLASLLRFYKAFSRFIKLMGRVFIDTFAFGIFFLVSIFIFSLILQAAGMKVDEHTGEHDDDAETEYPILGRGVKYLI